MKKPGLLVALVLVVVLFFWRHGKQQIVIEGPISSWIIPDSWSIGRGQQDGKLLISRFNEGLQAVAGNPAFSKQVGIAIPFISPKEDGMPGSDEMRQLSDIEDEIRSTFTVANESLFAGVITTGGMREFVLYSSNAAAAAAKAESLIRATKHHEVQYIVTILNGASIGPLSLRSEPEI